MNSFHKLHLLYPYLWKHMKYINTDISSFSISKQGRWKFQPGRIPPEFPPQVRGYVSGRGWQRGCADWCRYVFASNGRNCFTQDETRTIDECHPGSTLQQTSFVSFTRKKITNHSRAFLPNWRQRAILKKEKVKHFHIIVFLVILYIDICIHMCVYFHLDMHEYIYDWRVGYFYLVSCSRCVLLKNKKAIILF